MPKKKHITQLDGYIKPTKDMVKKAKAALDIPSKVKLPRCMAKSVGKVKAFEKAGDMSHSAPDHICDECRCRYRAGYGTAHLGMGFCIVHEQSREYRHVAGRVAESHKVAIRQGFPDKAYPYALSNPDKYVDEIRKAAEDSGGMTDLREDIILIRSKVQDLLNSFGEDGGITVRDKEGDLVEADDVTKLKLLDRLVRSVGKLSIDNLKLTEEDVVTLDQVKVWAYGVINLIERMAPNQKFRDEFVMEFAKLTENVKTGRK